MARRTQVRRGLSQLRLDIKHVDFDHLPTAHASAGELVAKWLSSTPPPNCTRLSMIGTPLWPTAREKVPAAQTQAAQMAALEKVEAALRSTRHHLEELLVDYDHSVQLLNVVGDKPLPIGPLRGDGTRELNLSGFRFGAVSGCLIGRLLRYNTSLKALDLSSNGIGTGRIGPPDEDFPSVGRAVIELATAIRYNFVLEQLKLASCALTDDGARLLARELQKSTVSRLGTLDLSRNSDVSEEAAELLRQARPNLKVVLMRAAAEERESGASPRGADRQSGA